MLFGYLAQCHSLREIAEAMLSFSVKTQALQLEHLPYCSTLSDANKRRNSEVFCASYNALLQAWTFVIKQPLTLGQCFINNTKPVSKLYRTSPQ
jgi:hypothetical protein